ncbi:MAG: 5-(carboxyamino)imidazole ribonucleotide synthase, partial [Myxococcales bacterium]|nr:5-(carboxyamino)imidazole ribonucleotide synthase [Myxococcales bacterium]
LGGGQLGRMLCLAARPLGVRTLVWTGGHEAPAAEVADVALDAGFEDAASLARFVEQATHATLEFENIPAATLEAVAAALPLHPSPRAVAICQRREAEKAFLRQHRIPCAEFALVTSAAELAEAMGQIAGPAVLKTAAFGYDGKGQQRLAGDEDPAAVWASFGADRAVIEAFVPFVRELSVMVVRSASGEMLTYDPAENEHERHILARSLVPARIPMATAERCRALAERVALALDYHGVLGVELFELADGQLLVNEMAPRPHNSGHHTLDACVTSQFEQQLRATCGLPLGSPRLLSPVVLSNLLGDLWSDDGEAPDWSSLFADPECRLHLYGKKEARRGRKMGHLNLLGESVETILPRLEALRARLARR